MATSEASHFYTAISAVFQGWTALQLAVTHSFGGHHSREKAEWLISTTEQWFKENSDIDSYELEEFLAEIMSSEFNSVVDDDSLAQVATKICKFYDLIKNGRIEEFHRVVGTLTKSADVTSCQRGQDDSDDGTDMNVDNENVLSHMNSLELSKTSEGTHSMTEDDVSETSQAQRDDNSAHNNKSVEGEDGWTTVTKRRGNR